jgi:ferredoxin--NADP+ reductase
LKGRRRLREIRTSFFLSGYNQMAKIVKKEILNQTQGVNLTKIEVTSVDIARKALPGQFIVLMVRDTGERIPLTIVDKDVNNGTITLIFQEAGFTTKLLGKMEVGDSLFSLVGPLGHPTEIKNFGKVILVGGGVGIAEILPITLALKTAGNCITTIIGARSRELLILENELKAVSDVLLVATDDGSYGIKGFTTTVLESVLNKDKYDLVYCVGPIPMMQRVSQSTKKFNLKTYVSLNALMVDATGMCGCCRVSVGNEVKFSCVDGPDFDAHLVDWDQLSKRNRVYSEQEKHICNLAKL